MGKLMGSGEGGLFGKYNTRVSRRGSAHIASATTPLHPLPPLCYHHPMTPSFRQPATAARAVNQPKPPLPDSQKKILRQTTVNQTCRRSACPAGRRQ